MRHISPSRSSNGRVDALLARVRSKQLASALHGRVLDSARYAVRAERLRRLRGEPVRA